MSESILHETEQEQIILASGEVVNPDELTPGQIIAEMFEIRTERQRMSQRDSDLVEIWRALEARLMALGDKMGMKQMASDIGTATITQETLPKADDWDEIYQYILDNDACHLLQRRISAAAYRELQDAEIDIPGISPYIQRKISLRKK